MEWMQVFRGARAIKKVFSPNRLSARIIFIVVLITEQMSLGVPDGIALLLWYAVRSLGLPLARERV